MSFFQRDDNDQAPSDPVSATFFPAATPNSHHGSRGYS
jgi:hypothetical protein